MITLRSAWIAGVVAILGASGCGADPMSGEERAAEAESALAAACPGEQMVGRVQPGLDCPDPLSNNWNKERLFAGLTPVLPPELDGFCLYTWMGTGAPDHGKLPFNGNAPPSAWLDPDCMVVAAMSPAEAALAAITPDLSLAFTRSIEKPAALPPMIGDEHVRVAMVDSWPGFGRIGNFEHGFGMAAIARQIACDPGAPCFLTTAPHLALDLVEPHVRDTFQGGFFGYQSRLARAIAEAVYTRAAVAPSDKLIINLSLGWDGRYNLGPDGMISDPVLAVQKALEVAACEGALVIAAAGNAGSGPVPGAGPVFPAAWNSLPAPTCAGPVPRPLVYAAGGLTGRDLQLDSARPGSLPEIGAPAIAVPGVMFDGTVVAITGPFTGSSVAAAVTSGIAASVWRRSPGLRADEVMNVLHSSAVPTPRPADVCLSPPCGVVRRLSLCRSLEAVMGAPLSCTKIPFGAGHEPTWTDADIAAVQPTAIASYDGSNLTSLHSPPLCHSPVFIPAGYSTFPDTWPCPSEQLPNSVVMPTVGPAPPPDPCPACLMYIDPGVDVMLLLAISKEVSTAYPQILGLHDRYGNTIARYDLASATIRSSTSSATLGAGLSGGEVYEVSLPVSLGGYLGSFDHAVIEWVNMPEAETTSTLLLKVR